jgi:hypothetical protein
MRLSVCLLAIVLGLFQSQRVLSGERPVETSQDQREKMSEAFAYQMFFTRQEVFEKIAAKKELAAKEAFAEVREAARLTEQEVEIVRRIVEDCNQALAKNDAETTKVLAEADSHPKDRAPKLEAMRLYDEKQAIIASHIRQLKTELGKDSFRRLDAYVASLVGPNARP